MHIESAQVSDNLWPHTLEGGNEEGINIKGFEKLQSW